jgi:hypothetical protein
MFAPVSRTQSKLRIALDGPAGSGKTYTALTFAFQIVKAGGRVAVLDTENGSAALYSGKQPSGAVWQWDNMNLMPGQYAPSTYAQAIKDAGAAGYDVLIIDSLSHAWEGTGGALDQVDKARDANKFTAWRNVTPQHRMLVESIMSSPCHIIATLRTKTEYVLEIDDRGKQVPRKIGTKPIQRDGMEYEFTIFCDLDLQHNLSVSKTRCPLIDGQVINKPTGEWIEPVREWLMSGVPVPTIVPGPIPVAAHPAGPAPAGSTPKQLTAEQSELRGLLLEMAAGNITEAQRLCAIYSETPDGKAARSVIDMPPKWVTVTLAKVRDAHADWLREHEQDAGDDQSEKEGLA